MHRPSELDTAWTAEADAALQAACPGWRRDHRCVDENGHQLANPHPECLAAEQRYRVILIEHDIR